MEGFWAVTIPVVFLIAVSTAVPLVFLRRSSARRLERARELAPLLGLALVEGDDALRKSYEDQGGLAAYERAMRLAGPALRFLSRTGMWRLEGERGGARVAVYLETRSTGSRSSTTYRVVRAYFPRPLPYELHVVREGLLSKLGKVLVGLQDVQVGDPEFDGAFRVRTSDPEAAARLLGRSDLASATLAAARLEGQFRVEKRWVQWERSGAGLDEEELRSVIEALAPIARAVGEALTFDA